MAFDMNEDRINRWKCLFCGSKHKKVIKHIRSTDGAHIGSSLFCCNCGHIDNFPWTVNLAKQLLNEGDRVTSDPQICCGLASKDLENCKNYKCPYRPNETSDEKPKVNTEISHDPLKLKPIDISNDKNPGVDVIQNLEPMKKAEPVSPDFPRPQIPPVHDESLVGVPYIPTYARHPHLGPEPGPEPIQGRIDNRRFPPQPPMKDNGINRPGVNENMKGNPVRKPQVISPDHNEPNLVVPVVNGSTGKI